MPASPTSSILTVAVPTCNGAQHLGEAIGSILAQDGVVFELLVSDDRSDDDTIDVVRAVAGDRARVVVNSERLGLAGNWNQCVALARNPLVAIFHQDDVMSPGHIEAHIRALGSDESAGLAACAALVIDERGKPISSSVVGHGGLGPVDRLFEAGGLAAEMAEGNPLRCSAVTMRVAAHRDAGGFDPSFRYVVDWDFWLRVSRKWKVAWLAKPTVRIRWHPGSETQRFKAGTDDLDESGRLLEELFAVDFKDRRDVSRLKSAANARLGRAYLNRAHDALRDGRPELAREALRRGFKRAPGLITTILRDPRLCIQMTALIGSPRLAGRLFGRSRSGTDGSGTDVSSLREKG